MNRISYIHPFFKLVITVCLLAVRFTTLPAQERDFRFEHLSIEDGLSQNLIFSIIQDSKGFIWVGTYDGLNRYDGYEFNIYTHLPADSLSIMANQIYALFEDRGQHLWVGAGGLNLYDRRNDRFVRVVTKEQIGQNIADLQIQDITEDRNGHIWMYVRNAGVYRLELDHTSSDLLKDLNLREKCRLVGPYPIPGAISGKLTGTETGFLAVAGNSLWLSVEKGLMVLEAAEGGAYPGPDQSGFREVVLKGIPPDKTIHELWVDTDESIWIGTQAGLVHLKDHRLPDQNEFYPIPLDKFTEHGLATPRSMALDQQGMLWIATYEGVLLFDLSGKTYRHLLYDPDDPEGLSYPSITKVFVDQGNLVWLGTAGMGLNNYATHRKQFEHYLGKQLTHTIYSVYDLLEDPEGDIWFSALSGSLFHYIRKTGEVLEIPDPFPDITWTITDMIRDTQGIFWITNDQLLIRYDPEGVTSRVYPITYLEDETVFPSDSMYTLTRDPTGDIWLVNTRNLKRFRPGRGFTAHFTLPEMPLERVNACHLDNRGVFWIASLNGLLRFDPSSGAGEWYRNDPADPGSLPYDHLTSLQPDPSDPQHTLWMGTGGGGLVRMTIPDGIFTNFTTADGLPNNYIYGVLADESGELWMSTNKGLSCFNPGTGVFRNYDRSDGIQSNEFNTRSCYRSPGGKLFFGGINGITAFYPEQIITNPYIPPVIITGMQLSYEPLKAGVKGSPLPYSITETKAIRLRHRQRTLAFEFAALDFTYPEKNRYRFRLEGFDQRWIDAGTDRRAFYTNLPAGKYIFEVTGSNNDGVFNQEGTSLEVVIPPHPWMKWYAFLVYAAMLGTAGYFLHQYLFERRKTRQEIMQREEETRRLTELDQFKSRFFANVSHEFRTPISLIQAQMEDLLQELKRTDLREKVISAQKNSEELLRLIDQLLDLARLEANKMKLHPAIHDLVPFVKEIVNGFRLAARRRQLLLDFNTETDQLFAAIDESAVRKIMDNLIFNALKFTEPGGRIQVSMGSTSTGDPALAEEGQGFLLIRVSDSGIGIDEAHLDHIFDRFYQVDHPSEKMHEGFGLGLGMVKELTELHGGSIQVQSEPGKGSVFIVKLPALRQEEYPAEPSVVQQVAHVPAKPEQGETKERKEHERIADVDSWSSMASSEILVVEDHQELREFIRTILQREYHVVLASDGRQGLEIARQRMPDLIITDVMMPVMDGFELVHQLLNDQRTSHIPVILLTAKAETDDRIKGLELGADDYLVKPFKQNELLSRVRNILRKREELQKKYAGQVLDGAPLEKEPTHEQLFLKEVRGWIETHLENEGFGVEQLAEAVHMSPSNLYRKLHALTNLSPLELVKQIRIDKAVRLLKQGLTVAEVSYQVGFQNPSSFTNFFRKQYGVSPREFLKK